LCANRRASAVNAGVGTTLEGLQRFKEAVVRMDCVELEETGDEEHRRRNVADKARIARAAGLQGVPISAFVHEAVLREAESVTAAELSVSLSVEESRDFLSVLDAPFKPNAKLNKALARLGKNA
jgi:uncharacterized protein (DUF1778 family)